MRFLLRHFYNISLFLGIAILLYTWVNWNDLNYLAALGLLNLAVINLHFFEEFGFPGGFPYFANTIFGYKDSPMPDRFPLNQMSAFLTNWGTALIMYLPPIIFPDKIWLGLPAILFGGVAQLIMHAIVNNRLLKTWYNGGLATVVFGHFPIMLFYIHYIEINDLVTFWDYVIAIALMVFWYVIGIRVFIMNAFKNLNSPYPFAKTEMDKFHKAYKKLPYKF